MNYAITQYTRSYYGQSKLVFQTLRLVGNGATPPGKRFRTMLMSSATQTERRNVPPGFVCLCEIIDRQRPERRVENEKASAAVVRLFSHADCSRYRRFMGF